MATRELVDDHGEITELEEGSLLDRILQETRPISYPTAAEVKVKRTLGDVRKRFLEEARLAGESFYYGWGAGQNAIEGPSQELAHSLARCWGNCVVEDLPMLETTDAWVFTYRFIDLETGFTLARSFRQSKKWTVHGKHDAERKDDIRFQIGQSKAARNVTLKALPRWLIDEGLREAKKGVRAAIEKLVADLSRGGKDGLIIAIDKALAALGKCGVTEERILLKCGITGKGGITMDHLVMLKGDLTAIENGAERAEALFPDPNANTAKKADITAKDVFGDGQSDPLAGVFDRVQACMTAAEISEIYNSFCGPETQVEEAERVQVENWCSARQHALVNVAPSGKKGKEQQKGLGMPQEPPR